MKTGKINEIVFLDFFNSLSDGQKERCGKIITDLLANKTEITDIYLDLYQRSLYTVGKMWDHSKLSVAEEHMATKIIENLLNLFRPFTNGRQVNKSAVISCVDKEYHELGARMAANIFEFNGWNTCFLGASVPTRELVRFVDLKKPDVVGLSFNLYLNLHRLTEVIDKIRKNHPDMLIIIGGQGLKEEKDSILTSSGNIKYFEDIKHLDNFLKSEEAKKI